jgi:plasmid maintenance system killer protein
MGKLIEAYGGNVTALTMAIIKGKEGKEIQEALAKVGKEEAIVLAKKAEEYKKLEKGTNTSSDATKKATKTERDYLDVLKDLNVVTEKMATKTIILDMATLNTAFRTGKIDADAYKAGMDILQAKLRDIGADAAGVVVPAARHMGMIWSQVSDKMAREAVYVKKTWAQNVQEMAQHWQEKMQQIVATTTQITGQISAINQQALTNKLQAIDNAYNKEKLAIVNSLKTEQEKADALKVLDAKFEAQRASAQRNYAKAQKAVALANAIVNTAEGVSKALASAPPPWNIALAAITGALGAIQIGLIARQPLPLARGAIFKRPTILTADSGSQYEVGDGGEPEVLSGPKQLRQAIFGERGEQQTGMRRTVHNHFHLYIGMEEIKEQVIKIVEEADALGQLTLRKAFA